MGLRGRGLGLTAIWPLKSCDTESQWVSGRKTSARVPADSRSLRASRVTGTREASGNSQGMSEPSGLTGSGKDSLFTPVVTAGTDCPWPLGQREFICVLPFPLLSCPEMVSWLPPRRTLLAAAARFVGPGSNQGTEQTRAHPALGGHQRPQRAGCSSAVVRVRHEVADVAVLKITKRTDSTPCSASGIQPG